MKSKRLDTNSRRIRHRNKDRQKQQNVELAGKLHIGDGWWTACGDRLTDQGQELHPDPRGHDDDRNRMSDRQWFIFSRENREAMPQPIRGERQDDKAGDTEHAQHANSGQREILHLESDFWPVINARENFSVATQIKLII